MSSTSALISSLGSSAHFYFLGNCRKSAELHGRKFRAVRGGRCRSGGRQKGQLDTGGPAQVVQASSDETNGCPGPAPGRPLRVDPMRTIPIALLLLLAAASTVQAAEKTITCDGPYGGDPPSVRKYGPYL